MTTKLDKAIKREIDFNEVAYTVTLSPQGLKIVEKGKRKGREMTWEELIGGSVALAHGLQSSIDSNSDQDDQE
jgi:long-subunit acyl-CoA synthetase (AMP-forming)